MKKQCIRRLSMLLLALCFCFLAIAPVKTHAASGKRKALKAYKTFLNKIRKQNKKSKFALAYIDGDSIPELYVIIKVKGDSIGGIYKYSGGKVKRAHEINFGKYDQSNIKYYYYKKTGVSV